MTVVSVEAPEVIVTSLVASFAPKSITVAPTRQVTLGSLVSVMTSLVPWGLSATRGWPDAGMEMTVPTVTAWLARSTSFASNSFRS